MTSILLGLLVPVVIVGWLIGYVIWRGLQMRELVQSGVETQAVIESKRAVKPSKGSGRHQYKIVYRYTDSSDNTHSRTTVTTSELYDQYDEGQPFPIVYSSKRPHISARKDEVDAARKALNLG